MVDEAYKFPWTSLGGNGTASDVGIISECFLRAALVENTIMFHPAEPLPQDYRNIQYFIPGDDAFPLRPWLTMPYSMKGMTHEQRVFNFWQSRARHVVENIFGILVHRWRCLPTTMQIAALPVPTGTVTLHSWMRTRAPARVRYTCRTWSETPKRGCSCVPLGKYVKSYTYYRVHAIRSFFIMQPWER